VRGTFWSAVLIIIVAVVMGCGETIFPCLEDTDCTYLDSFDYDLADDDGEDDWEYPELICNESVSVKDRCNEWIEYAPIPDVCSDLPDFLGVMGTCQVPGGQGDTCAEDLDCISGNCTLRPGDDVGECRPPPECVVDADCDDGVFCNGAETCDVANGTCRQGAPVDCDDDVACTLDTCDAVSDTCVNTPDDVSCDDGNVCNGIETCDPASDCQPGEPLVCEDGDLCTTDSCDSVAGCLFTPVECETLLQCDPEDGQCKP